MKNAPPHTGKWLRELFPEQTKSIPAILLWTVVYILDVIAVFFAAWQLGFDLLQMHHSLRTTVMSLFLVLALVLFWLETLLYRRILRMIRQRNTPH